VIRPTVAGRVDQLAAELDELVPTAGVDVVMFQKHRRRQHDIGHCCGFGHELLMHDHEQIFAREPLFNSRLVGRDGNGIGVLDQHRLHRRTAAQGIGIAGQNGSDA
jgi:hypothetical protein